MFGSHQLFITIVVVPKLLRHSASAGLVLGLEPLPDLQLGRFQQLGPI
jgi:hypothetical protein